MHKPESVLENETHKILGYLEILKKQKQKKKPS